MPKFAPELLSSRSCEFLSVMAQYLLFSLADYINADFMWFDWLHCDGDGSCNAALPLVHFSTFTSTASAPMWLYGVRISFRVLVW